MEIGKELFFCILELMSSYPICLLTFQIKMSLRAIGLAGYNLLFAHFTMAPPRSPSLRRLGETLVGIYLACSLYMVLQNPEEKAAYIKHLPLGTTGLYIYAVFMAVCALCYLPGMFVNDVTQALIPILLATTLLHDCQFQHWKRQGMDYWNQIRMVSDNFAIALGGLMYIACTKKVTYEDVKRD